MQDPNYSQGLTYLTKAHCQLDSLPIRIFADWVMELLIGQKKEIEWPSWLKTREQHG